MLTVGYGTVGGGCGPQVNNCVGIGNHKLFLLFIFYIFVMCMCGPHTATYRGSEICLQFLGLWSDGQGRTH